MSWHDVMVSAEGGELYLICRGCGRREPLYDTQLPLGEIVGRASHERPEPADGARWRGPVAVIDRPTTDGRVLLDNRSSAWPLPLPLLIGDGTLRQVGVLERCESQRDGVVWGFGTITAAGVEAVQDGHRALGLELGDYRLLPGDARALRFSEWTARAVTLGDDPAWPECLIELDEPSTAGEAVCRHRPEGTTAGAVRYLIDVAEGLGMAIETGADGDLVIVTGWRYRVEDPAGDATLEPVPELEL